MKNRENLVYFLSAILPMNVIVLLKVVFNFIFIESNETVFKISAIVIVSCITLAGLISLILICKTVASPQAKTTVLTVINADNNTSQKYFTHFSLFILTGLAIPVENSILCFILIVFLEVMLATVYIKENMIYLNPILNVLGYEVYTATCTDENNKRKKYIFLAKGCSINQGTVIDAPDSGNNVTKITQKNIKEESQEAN